MSAEQENDELEQRMHRHHEWESRLDQLYENLKVAQDFVWKREIENADRHFYDYCANFAGATVADTIKAVDFSTFHSGIRESIDKIVSEYIPQRLNMERPVKAIYYEYDPNNWWGGHFFACLDYVPVNFGDDEWACDWEEYFEGPTVPEYNDMIIDDLHIISWFLESDQSLGKFSYAVVRIYLEFARACFRTVCPVPICIGFHDQSDISRVFPD